MSVMILTTATSCGRIDIKRPQIEQNAELLEYAIDFNTEHYGYKGTNAPINTIALVFVETMPKPAVGRCFDRNRIEILKSYWDAATVSTKRQLMYHELGHCALGREHNEITVPTIPTGGDGRASIMNHMLLSDEMFERNYGVLIKELFTGEQPQYLFSY